jgi:hypothetical protein
MGRICTAVARRIAALAAALALSGCLVLPGAGTGPSPDAVPQGAMPAAGEVVASPLPPATAAAPQEGRAPDAVPSSSASILAADAGAGEGAATAPETRPEPPPDPATRACTRGGGRMVAGPGGFGRVCVTPTQDAGKPCRTSGDCSGHCLARGNVCAPITPLMGCHDILLAQGQRTTQCIE